MAKKLYIPKFDETVAIDDSTNLVEKLPTWEETANWDEVDVPKKKDISESTPEVPESESKGLGSVPEIPTNTEDIFSLRYDDNKFKLNELHVNQPKPVGYGAITDKLNTDVFDIVSRAEAAKPAKTDIWNYVQGTPNELNRIVANTLRWVGNRMMDVDQILGGVPGYINAKSDIKNPEAKERATLQEEYLKEKDPERKNILGEKINILRVKQNPFLQAADIFDKSADNLKAFPDNIPGNALKGVVDFAPLVVGLMVTPEITLPKTLGTVFKIPKFTTLEAVKGFYKGSTQPGTIKERLKAGTLGGISGATSGTILHGLGVTSGQLGRLVGDATKSNVIGGTSASLANGIGFFGYDAASQLIETGEVDLKQSVASGTTGFLLGIPSISSAVGIDVKVSRNAYKKAFDRFITSPDQVVSSVQQMNIDPFKLREQSNRLGEEAISADTPEKKNDLLSTKRVIDSVLDINAISNDVVADPQSYRDLIKNSELSGKEKENYLAKIDNVLANSNELRANTDDKIRVSRENGVADKEPELFISEETSKVFNDIELDSPITNIRLKEASDNLYQEYKRLETTKNSQTRTNTIDEINEVQDFLEKQITNLENQRNIQRERGLFLNLKSRGRTEEPQKPKSEPKVSPKKENAPTPSLEPLQTRESMYKELTDKGKTPEEANAFLDMFEEFTDPYKYTPEEYGKAKEAGTLPVEESQITTEPKITPIEEVKEPNIAPLDITKGNYQIGERITDDKGNTGKIIKIEEQSGDVKIEFDNGEVSWTQKDSPLKLENINKIGGQKNESNDGEKRNDDGEKRNEGKGNEEKVAQETLKKIEDNESVQEPQSAKMDVRQQTGNGERVGERNAETQIPSKQGEETQTAQEAPAEEKDIITRTTEIKEILSKDKKDGVEQSGFLVFGRPLNIFRNPRAKNKPMKPMRQFLREQFTAGRGMPKSVFKAWMVTKGKINARRLDIEQSYKESAKEIFKSYGSKLTEKNKEDIQLALENLGTSQDSKDIAFNIISSNIPKEAQGVIERMRKMVDDYTDDIKVLDMIGGGLEERMGKNRGYYLTRTYKKHTDRDWVWETIPDKIKEDAAQKLIEIYPDRTNDEILGMMKSMVESKDMTDMVIKPGNSLADIDKSSLKKRSVFLTDNIEIRTLLGENRDPFYNYAVSLTRMTEIAERGKMLENIRDVGLKEGWLSEKQSHDKNHIDQIKYNQGLLPGKEGVKQLGDYYTTPEIAKSISSFMEPTTVSGKFMRIYMKAITATKISKTAGSVKGAIRNFKSNTTNAIANANWNIPQTTAYLYSHLKNKESFHKFWRELAEFNIIGDSSNAGELMRNVQDLSDNISFIAKTDESLNEVVQRKIVDKMIRTYGFMDDVWKIYRYASEYTRYNDAYVKSGMNPDEASKLAKESVRDILHKTSTYYSQLPTFIQNMRRLPFANTFISFPYLTTVNYLGTIQTAVNEMGNPALRHIGIQRMAGSIMGISALALASAFGNKLAGVDEKKIEEWRRFLPDFWKNDIITISKDNGNGVAEYNNTSYMDYYGAISTPLLMLQRKYAANGTITDEDLLLSSQEFFGKFIGWDILFDRVTKLKANQEDNGQQIYNPQDTWAVKYRDMSNYLISTVEPGTLTDARRIYKTYREGGEWQKQAVGVLSGNQSRTIDPLKSMSYYILPKYKDQLENARKIYISQLRTYDRLKEPDDMDKTVLATSKKRAQSAINKIVEEMQKDYNAALTVGVKKQDLDDVITSPKLRLDVDIRNVLLYNLGVILNEDGGISRKYNQQ